MQRTFFCCVNGSSGRAGSSFEFAATPPDAVVLLVVVLVVKELPLPLLLLAPTLQLPSNELSSDVVPRERPHGGDLDLGDVGVRGETPRRSALEAPASDLVRERLLFLPRSMTRGDSARLASWSARDDADNESDAEPPPPVPIESRSEAPEPDDLADSDMADERDERESERASEPMSREEAAAAGNGR